jgi:integrase
MSEFTHESLSLYAANAERKYTSEAERQRFLEVMGRQKSESALFSLLLAWTGGRPSEVLALMPLSFQIERNVVILPTLKRRKPHAREVPIPPGLMAAIDRRFRLRELQQDPETASKRLWSWSSRVTVWRFVKGGMLEAGIVGRAACPRGLRHGFAVNALQASVPLNVVQKWLGHARISTTAIYTAVAGPEEMVFAERFWRSASTDGSAGAARPVHERKCGLRRRQRRMPVFEQFKQWSVQAAIAVCAILTIAAGLQAVARLVAP